MNPYRQCNILSSKFIYREVGGLEGNPAGHQNKHRQIMNKSLLACNQKAVSVYRLCEPTRSYRNKSSRLCIAVHALSLFFAISRSCSLYSHFSGICHWNGESVPSNSFCTYNENGHWWYTTTWTFSKCRSKRSQENGWHCYLLIVCLRRMLYSISMYSFCLVLISSPWLRFQVVYPWNK